MTNALNLKKILLSLLGIAVIATVVTIGATGAFFSDTETSEGNVFTAGSIDLKVDHTKQTYNGVDCQTCDVTVKSDTSNMVVEKDGTPITPSSAVVLTPTHPAWTADVDGTANDANWIWVTNPVSQADTTVDTTYTFEKTFNWMGPITGAAINFAVAADNGYEVFLNGIQIAVDPNENNFSSADTVVSVNVSNNVIQGTNVLQFKVTNKAMSGGNPQSNPAGLLYKLVIDGNCQDTYFINQCNLWSEKDLGEGDTFFDFDDIKPADWGTNVISLHVSSNDAYSCLIVDDKDDQENTLLAPETVAGDTPTSGNPSGFGELSNFLNVFTWGDTNGDGNYDSGETALGSGPLSTLSSIMSMDAGSGTFLTATTTKYIGMAWCAGTLTPNQGGQFDCDGSTMDNTAQSDSFSASLTAYAEQVRNNEDFSCSTVDLDPVQDS